MKKTFMGDQRGAGHLIIVVIVVLAVVAGAGYLVYSKQNKKSDTAETASLANIASSKEVQDACLDELDDKDFCKFASNWAGTEGSYTSTITTENSDGKSVMVIKAESDKKTSSVTTVNGTETAAYIGIDSTFYIKDYTDGKWTKYVNDDSVSSSQTSIKDDFNVDEFTSSDAESDSTVTYKKIGKEACGSLTCFKYQIIDTTAPDSEQFIWFDDDHYVMRRLSTKDSTGSFDMVITYGKVTVSAPSPTKDAPDYSTMLSGDSIDGFDPSDLANQ